MKSPLFNKYKHNCNLRLDQWGAEDMSGQWEARSSRSAVRSLLLLLCPAYSFDTTIFGLCNLSLIWVKFLTCWGSAWVIWGQFDQLSICWCVLTKQSVAICCMQQQTPFEELVNLSVTPGSLNLWRSDPPSPLDWHCFCLLWVQVNNFCWCSTVPLKLIISISLVNHGFV